MAREQAVRLDKQLSSVLKEVNVEGRKENNSLFFAIVDRMNQVMVWFAGTMILLMMALIVLNSLKRMVSAPFAGTVEVVCWLGALAGMFSLGYAQLHKSHVFIDLIITKLSPVLRKTIHTMINIVCSLFFCLAGWQLFIYGLSLIENGVVSETLRVIYYPVVMIGSLGFLGLVLAMIKETILVWKE